MLFALRHSLSPIHVHENLSEKSARILSRRRAPSTARARRRPPPRSTRRRRRRGRQALRRLPTRRQRAERRAHRRRARRTAAARATRTSAAAARRRRRRRRSRRGGGGDVDEVRQRLARRRTPTATRGVDVVERGVDAKSTVNERSHAAAERRREAVGARWSGGGDGRRTVRGRRRQGRPRSVSTRSRCPGPTNNEPRTPLGQWHGGFRHQDGGKEAHRLGRTLAADNSVFIMT